MSAYRSVSVATIVRGRQDHFDNLVSGLTAQEAVPDELVVAHMQPDPPQVAQGLPFRVRTVAVAGDELPLAAARNAAAAAASGEVFAFLDVDCIPDPAFARRAREAVRQRPGGVFLPEVRYLPAAARGWRSADADRPDYARLAAAGLRHGAKPDLAGVDMRKVGDYGELWGLAFVLARADWFAAGGMDEAYVGYGGEETDFAQRLRVAGLELYWLGGTICFHQHHPVHRPPLHHFASIVRNARIFHDCWGRWCMDYWLDAFADRGLIERSADRIAILREPTAAEIAGSRMGADVRFS